MTELLALSVSIAVLGGIWAFIALGPLGGFALVWLGSLQQAASSQLGVIPKRLARRSSACGGFSIGQNVKVNNRFRGVYSRSKAQVGRVASIARGTEVSVLFNELKHPLAVDVRLLEPLDP